MEENQPNNSLDRELAEVNKQNEGGFIDDNPEDPKVEDENTEEEEVEEDKGSANDIDKNDEVEDENEEKEEEDDSTEDKKEDEDEDETEEDDEDKNKQQPNRPEKYIPIPKYQKAKNDLKIANETIADLKSKLEGKEEGSVEEDDELKEWAEKNNMAADAAQDLLKIARKGMVSQKDIEKFKQIQQENEAKAEINHFESEYKDIEPIISQDFPQASEDAKKKAKDLMDKLAHTRKYHNTELGYVLYKEKAQFEKILKTTPSRKGMEGEQDKRSTGGPKAFDPTSIKKGKDGKYDFSSIDAIEDPNERMQAIEALPAEPYVDYVNLMDDGGLEINRDGRKISLS